MFQNPWYAINCRDLSVFSLAGVDYFSSRIIFNLSQLFFFVFNIVLKSKLYFMKLMVFKFFMIQN